MARVQHATLPDEYLHEPKGATTALEGTVYVADGEASGSFKKLPVSSLDAIPEVVDNLVDDLNDVVTNGVVENIADVVNVDGTGLTISSDGTLQDVPYDGVTPIETVDAINKDLAEYYRIFLNVKTISETSKKDIAELTDKINQILTALKNFGVIANG